VSKKIKWKYRRWWR